METHAPSLSGVGRATPDTHNHPAHYTPMQRLLALARENRSDLMALLAFAIVTGLVGLMVPLAAQSLVNIIAAGLFRQPVIVLTFGVLTALLLVGILRLLQMSLVETLLQRVFARIALRLASLLTRIQNTALSQEYAPELINRFFDVLTIQKTLSKLLLDGLSAVLQAGAGLVLLAFYDSTGALLGFDLFVILFSLFVLFVLGYGGLRTSIQESAQKYRVAEWLEEMARCQVSFKVNGAAAYLIERADSLVVAYLQARRRHFRVLLRQAVGSYLFQAVASAGILGIGGSMVINRQLTLGQLVAAELIVLGVLNSLEKLVRQSEQLFDLLTGLDKVGHLSDLPMERPSGRDLPKEASARVVCRNIRFAYPNGNEVLTGLNFTVEPGERVSLVGVSGAGKSTLAALLCGLEEPSHGTVEIGGYDIRDVSLESLRDMVALVGDTDDIFEGTIEENIVVGRAGVSHEDIRRAVEMVGLTEEIARLPQGLKTRLVSTGKNLSRGQVQRLMIARAIVDRPRLLILDEAFTGIDEKTKLKILDAVFAAENTWTIIDISHDAEVVMRATAVQVLAQGRIVEQGDPQALCLAIEREFPALFPELAQQIRERRRATERGGEL